MKKLFLFSVLVLSTITMSAQFNFEYVGSIPYLVDFDYYYNGSKIDYVISREQNNTNTIYHIYYLATGAKYKDVTIPTYQGQCSWMQPYWCYKDFWTSDGKVCFIVVDSECDGTYKLYNEDGQIIKTFNGCPTILQGNDGVYVLDVTDTNTEIYKKKEVSSQINTPSAPARTTNARKIIKDGQMYIILDGVKYTVTSSTLQ